MFTKPPDVLERGSLTSSAALELEWNIRYRPVEARCTGVFAFHAVVGIGCLEAVSKLEVNKELNLSVVCRLGVLVSCKCQVNRVYTARSSVCCRLSPEALDTTPCTCVEFRCACAGRAEDVSHHCGGPQADALPLVFQLFAGGGS